MEPTQPYPKECKIEAFMHCKKCLDEKPEDISPADWGKIGVGWTIKGLQVWCERHNINILNLDFKGQKVDRI